MVKSCGRDLLDAPVHYVPAKRGKQQCADELVSKHCYRGMYASGEGLCVCIYAPFKELELAVLGGPVSKCKGKFYYSLIFIRKALHTNNQFSQSLSQSLLHIISY